MQGAVLVVGGGIGGVQAALDLAEQGYCVHLVNKTSSIGGLMTQLDKTFPTKDCAMCILSPKLVECARHPNIRIWTLAEVDRVIGKVGAFKVTLLLHPRYVKAEKCTGCGECTRVCPVKIPDEYNFGLSKTSNIRIRFPQAVPLIATVEEASCLYLSKGRCRLCEKACTRGAIDFDQKPQRIHVEVGAIILAPGYVPFDPRSIPEYGYAKFKNVFASYEYERILSASGPTGGKVVRPSDGREPKKIAFIQCVGSRSLKYHPYCSSVCCMYTNKQALITLEHIEGVECTIFGMDVRMFGKESERVLDEAIESGIRYVHARVARLQECQDGNLLIYYEDDEGCMKEERFQLAVLACGISPLKEAEEFSQVMGVELDEWGFCKSASYFTPFVTTKEGIFAAGAFVEPKDIPDTVAQASAAAAAAALTLKERREPLKLPEYKEERVDTALRVGVFVCHCGLNIAGVLNIKGLVEYAKTLPYVVYATDNVYSCSQDSQFLIEEAIKEHGLNRVVVAACTPRTHEPLFQDTLRKAGLNPYLFEFANIRDQCSWVHTKQREAAQRKAEELIKSAVSKVCYLSPLQKGVYPVKKKALVIGGGIAGMNAAWALAECGVPTYLVECTDTLGGRLKYMYYLFDNANPKAFLDDCVNKVMKHPNIKVYKNTKIVDVQGYVGNFTVRLNVRGTREESVEVGAIIVATGAQKYEKIGEYLYGVDPDVVTQLELEELLYYGKVKAENVVMILCVGSREKGAKEYCSRICCTEAVMHALKLKEEGKEVYILYRDIRTYGFAEEYYRRAREAGIVFCRYHEDKKPLVERKDGRLSVTFFDPMLQRYIMLPADLVVLNVGMVPYKNEELAKMLKVPLTPDGFFLEAHVKLRPVEFATEGIYLCGFAHSPKFPSETVTQSYAAASRALTLLLKDAIEGEAKIATVKTQICKGCHTCEKVCAYGAVEVLWEEREKAYKAKVNEALCKGCGACAASCPANAVDVAGFSNTQIFSQINALIS